MPINKKMMDSMKQQYGKIKGKKVYYAVEAKQRAQSSKPRKKKA